MGRNRGIGKVGSSEVVGGIPPGRPLARKFGKLPFRFDKRTLQFGRYVTPTLPPPPPQVDWTRGFNFDYGMMLNGPSSNPVVPDGVGDCTEAAKGHGVQVWTLDNGRMETVPDSVILAQYEANGGYVPGDPSTDNGENELDTLNAWRQNGFGGVQLMAYASINPQTLAHVQQGIYLFGFTYIGFQVPQSAMDQNAAGETWDVVADDGGIVGGHAVVIPAYVNATGVFTCITWGARQKLTWAFMQRYVDEMYVLLSPAWLGKHGLDPSGFNLSSLQADLNAVTG